MNFCLTWRLFPECVYFAYSVCPNLFSDYICNPDLVIFKRLYEFMDCQYIAKYDFFHENQAIFDMVLEYSLVPQPCLFAHIC